MSIPPLRHVPGTPWTREAVAALLAQTVGDDKAASVVEEAAMVLGLRLRSGLTAREVLELLDHVAQQPGIVGITARFAKSRVLLQR